MDDEREPIAMGPIEFANLLCRVQGCTCIPAIVVETVESDPPFSQVSITHDNSCRILYKVKSGTN